jgi:hypothetical protein
MFVELLLGAKMMIAWGCWEAECWVIYLVQRKMKMEKIEYRRISKLI